MNERRIPPTPSRLACPDCSDTGWRSAPHDQDHAVTAHPRHCGSPGPVVVGWGRGGWSITTGTPGHPRGGWVTRVTGGGVDGCGCFFGQVVCP